MVQIAYNPMFHKAKHIEIDCYLVREKLQVSLIHLLSVSTHNQMTDVFIKALPPALFHQHQSKL